MTEDGGAAEDELSRFVYRLGEAQALTEGRCFLCGVVLEAATRTDEHVFPQWLLRRFDLYRETVNLLNGTSMPYARMLIPCCRVCNNEYLSRLEEKVSKAFETGPEAVAALDRATLFLWMGKIYYGLLFRELFLLQDRRDREAGTIVPPELLSEFRMHHLLMQAARGVVRWREDQFPASIFVFRAQEPSRPKDCFDYFDVIQAPFLAIRVGSTVVVSALQDWGALEHAVQLPALEAAKVLDLHPQQFREVAAIAGYTASLFNRVPKHLIHAAGDHVEVFTMPLGGLSLKPLYDPFEAEDFAHVLAVAFGQPVEDLFDGQYLMTLLRDGEGAPWAVPWPADEWVRPSLAEAKQRPAAGGPRVP
ncbi:hypothetical protein OG824_20395 [Streptomyces prunicolor]|uniref:hypothetical protein n=1 Tax=Streptomyces prunicolor TaxID=67348 RepID=UPI0022504AC9|nr:hypothetical protein [Streptomyces prunicolor]MCX5237566.1 hypothetical protein [Streptomyces prunicolor]